MTDGPELTADCTACAALCCRVFAFEKSEDFALDKPAGVACPNLDGQGGCTIHASRAEAGFGGCIRFDCHGAGQAVSRDFPAPLPGPAGEETSRAFYIALDLFRAAHLVQLTSHLPLDPADAARRRDLLRQLARPESGWTLEKLRQLQGSGYAEAMRQFLADMRRYVVK